MQAVSCCASGRASSFLIDGEAVIARADGMPDFRALRSRSRGSEAVLHAFDLIQHDGEDLRHVALIERKRQFSKLIGRAKHAIRFVEHLAGDGPTVFEHAALAGGHRVEADGCALSRGYAGVKQPAISMVSGRCIPISIPTSERSRRYGPG